MLLLGNCEGHLFIVIHWPRAAAAAVAYIRQISFKIIFDREHNQSTMVILMSNVIAGELALPKPIDRFIYGLHILATSTDLGH